jgi:hypothetical protein
MDGLNDLYHIGHWGRFNYDLRIHNRWGALMFEQRNAPVDDTKRYWNGRVMNTGPDCPSGSYFYTFSFYLKGADQAPVVVNGSLTLLRQEP